MAMKKKQIVALFVATVLMLFGFDGFCVSAEKSTHGSDASLSLDNNELRVVFEEDGAFEVTELATEKTFASSLSTEEDNLSTASYRKMVSSELVIHYYLTEESLTSANTNIAYSIDATKTVAREGDSIRVKYDFSECEVRVDVVYTLKDDYLSSSIDFTSLEEHGEFSVCNMELLPGLGAGNNKDNGYMFVPDGSGALIHFNNGETKQYQSDVYGTESTQEISLMSAQTETVRMPVFGVVRNDTAVFGIIDSGDAIASIHAISGHSENFYNTAYSRVNITHTYARELFANDSKNASTAYHKTDQTSTMDAYTVLYRFFAGSDADYSGMALAYREYLIEEKGLEKNVSEPVLNVNVIGAIDVKKNFLGLTYYKPLALTTYEQTQGIAQSLRDSGVERVALRYIGWNNDGISNEKLLKKLKVMRALGGTDAFESLNKILDETNTSITYDVDFTKFYKGSKKYQVMSPFNEMVGKYRYLRSVYSQDLNTRAWYQLTPSHWSSVMENVFSSSEKCGITNMSLSALTSSIYSDFRASDPITREETKEIALQILQSADDSFAISGDRVNAYAFPYVDKIYEAPCYTSGYFVLDEEIPFYQMVLHGYIDMTAPTQFTAESRDINYLKAVETGSQLLYTGVYSSTDKVTDTDYDYLYGSQYLLWADDASEKYAEYYPLLKKIYDSEIVSHAKISENVFQTTYANGVSVIVNYNDTVVHVNGMEIAEYGFCEVM